MIIKYFRQQIQEALNKQTYHQFLAYAQQTHPGEPEKVGETVNLRNLIQKINFYN